MQKKYFGTDGIRGTVGNWPISAEFMLRLGRAAGVVLGRVDKPTTIVIGKDTRVSGYMFEAALEAGLVAAGANVRLLGPIPTPAVAMLVRSMRADAGIVISASHNPYADNGIKFFSPKGEKLSDTLELAIERELDAPFQTVEAHDLGKASRVEGAITRYVEYCKSTVAGHFNLDGMRIVLDCAHGATYVTAPQVFRELGAEVIVMGGEPDGFNINAGVGSTHPLAMQKAVAEYHADAGISFDGDGDRVIMADSGGRLVDGDDILYMLARAWRRQGRLKETVVGTVMTNLGIEQALGRLDIPFGRADVGDRHVLKQLRDQGGNLGGEASGHILCLDRSSTGDGIVSALAVLEALVDSGETVAEALADVIRVPQKTLNVRVDDSKARVGDKATQALLTKMRAQLGKRGRIVLRPSGTEPVVRITVEAQDREEIVRIGESLARLIQAR